MLNINPIKNRNVVALPALDGIRGLLALWVVASHVLVLTAGPNSILSKGGIAVDLFMMISGFLMFWNVQSRTESEPTKKLSTWKYFYTRRFFRIAPLYYLALIPSYIFHDYWHRLHTSIYQAQAQELVRPFLNCAPAPWQDFILHISFLYGLFPCSSSTNLLPDWSLSLEMQFYALFPLIFVFYKRSRIFVVLISIGIVAIASQTIGVYAQDPQRLISFPQPSILALRINCFITGILLADILLQRDFRKTALVLFSISAIVFQRYTFSAIVFLIFFTLLDYETTSSKITNSLIVLAQKLRLVLSCQPAKVLGDSSYGIYLLHLFILFPLIDKLYSFDYFINSNGAVRSLIAGSISAPLIVILAWLSHNFVEKIGIDTGRKLIKRFQQKSPGIMKCE
jgi:peptidoglycan/LPS O-acetylase OafA/YrhL